jgi:bifunctional DNA-binding transcriptional regulator/antitoxin component of YhaV-PrlF toxin-antitoxin module
MMHLRKVVKVGNGLFVGIPAEVCENLGLERGDTLRMIYLEGYGFLMVKDYGEEEVPIPIQRLASMKLIADNIVADLRRRARSIMAQFSFNFMSRIMSDLIRGGILKVDYDRVREEAGRMMIQDIKQLPNPGTQKGAVERVKKKYTPTRKRKQSQGKG